VVRIAGGVVLVLVGIVLLVGQDARPSSVVRAAVASLAVLAGVAIVLAPWWLRLVRELGDERAARAREAERADIAAHLHDSVLQTLALIRARSTDADTVARLARAQERELREWLYDDRPSPGTSLAAELRGLVAEVEDGRVGRRAEALGAPGGGVEAGPVVVDVVVVGDCAPTQETAALLQATREALVNAVAHGAPPYSVFLEAGAASVEVFVRDRGNGFRMDDVAPDRFGVRESILGRVQRRGGTAEIISRPGWGTEVRLRVPRGAPAGAAPEHSEETP
jgi:signal transduction histidine kinase